MVLNVIGRKGVINNLPIPAVADQFRLLQHPELMGDGGFGHAQKHGDIADTHLSTE
jgi:hypothetical protein